MADDLDDMLLAAAGSKSSSGRSSSEDDFDEDDEDEEEEHRGGKPDSRGGSKMPLKKRFEPGDGGGYESDISYGSDLYRDEEDQRKLAELTELELFNRYERRQNYKCQTEGRLAGEQRQHQSQSSQQQQQQRGKSSSSAAAAASGPPSSRVRSSGRDSSKKAYALNELVKRRNAQDSDQRKRAAAAARSSSPVPSSDGDSEEDLSSRESNRSEALPSDDDEERASLPSNEDIKKITIQRSKLFKWFMEPFFEETIVGCFVRIVVGQSKSGRGMYRLYLVRSVDAKDPDKHYKFENRVTYKYLNCTSGGDESNPVKWQMVRASETAPSNEEINAWKSEVMKSGGSSGGLVSKSSVAEKVAALEKVNSFVYSAAAVKQMVQEKKLTATTGEKERLTKELGQAENRDDQEQVERLQEKIRELEANAVKLQKSKNEKAERIEMMNRFENFKNASELRPAAKIGEAGYDPFSGRWTRSQNYYKPEAPKSAEDQSEAAMAEKAAKEREMILSEAGKVESSGLGGSRQYSKMFQVGGGRHRWPKRRRQSFHHRQQRPCYNNNNNANYNNHRPNAPQQASAQHAAQPAVSNVSASGLQQALEQSVANVIDRSVHLQPSITPITLAGELLRMDGMVLQGASLMNEIRHDLFEPFQTMVENKFENLASFQSQMCLQVDECYAEVHRLISWCESNGLSRASTSHTTPGDSALHAQQQAQIFRLQRALQAKTAEARVYQKQADEMQLQLMQVGIQLPKVVEDDEVEEVEEEMDHDAQQDSQTAWRHLSSVIGE